MRGDPGGVSRYFAVQRKKQIELFIPTLAQSLSKWGLKEAVWRLGFSVCFSRFSRHIQNKSPTVLLLLMVAQLEQDYPVCFHEPAQLKDLC